MILKGIFKGLIALLLLCASLLSYAEESNVLLLKTYKPSHNVVGWLMSEKLDGMRAIWDGKTLKTRRGSLIAAPDWFIAALPPFAIDGELWTERNDFENIISIVRRLKPDERWKSITYNIFEVPDQTGGLLARLAVLEDYLSQHEHTAFIKVIPQTTVVSKNQLKSELEKIIALGGEGLVVRKPETHYHTGRSGLDLKVKQYQDTECTVIAYKEGHGKYIGKTGSLHCQLASGQTFFIGSGLSDKQRTHPPKIGSLVTFKYYGLTAKGKPRFPVFMRERLPE